jgi:hypothetical protein
LFLPLLALVAPVAWRDCPLRVPDIRVTTDICPLLNSDAYHSGNV